MFLIFKPDILLRVYTSKALVELRVNIIQLTKIFSQRKSMNPFCREESKKLFGPHKKSVAILKFLRKKSLQFYTIEQPQFHLKTIA